MRRTLRRASATGGVPIDIRFERPKPQRPELFLLCDISGSVADFSFFTLTLMGAISAEIDKTRSFVFVDAVDEITDLLARTDHAIEPWQIMRNTNVIGLDGHSDYGAVLQQFWDDTGATALRSSSTVVICGDARANNRDANAGVLGLIAQRCRKVYWLNPEPRREWDTLDSEMASYGEHCTAVFEVRTLEQLADCVEEIL